MTDEEHDAASLRLRAGFVVLVGLSGALVAIQAGGDGVQIGVALLGGLLIGVGLLWFLSRLAAEFSLGEGARRSRRR